MKKNKILNISLLTTLLLFTACSNSQKQLKKEPLSVYNIMGITETNNNYIVQRDLPTSDITYESYIEPVNNNFVEYNNDISSDITYVSYKEPVNKDLVEYNNNMTSDITYISYRKPENKNFAEYNNNMTSDITYVSYKKPTNNYAPRNYNFEPNAITVQKIENRAKSFLGTPYVWGATGPNKFDCSGFTQWVYRDAGINIPRVSRDQARVGQFVSFNQLQKGDMIFFDTHKKRTGKVSHVGIYLGGGNFIHASSAGKSVVIYNFNQKPFYKKRFLWGRRVLNPNLHYALN